jgi:uncharacterized protein (TIGR01777 family)
MRVVVAGATGMIGRSLVRSLVADGHETVAITRRQRPAEEQLPGGTRVVAWDAHASPGDWCDALRGADAVVNLAGANIGARPWTGRRRGEILHSRIRTTSSLVAAMRALPPDERPRVLINASGVDYYADARNTTVTEKTPGGRAFLARVCAAWEAAAARAEPLGVRVVCLRQGIVLAPTAPAFRVLALPVRFFVGGRLGGGDQPVSWIHIDDLVRIYRLAMEDTRLHGPVNTVAPVAPSQEEFVAELGRQLKRPTVVRLREAVLRFVMGQQADLLLHGRPVRPTALAAVRYRFSHGSLAGALRATLKPPPPTSQRPRRSPFDGTVMFTATPPVPTLCA